MIEISVDKDRLDVDLIHHFLSTQSAWALGIPKKLVEKSITNSLCFGVYEEHAQIGFARVVSDFATFAYLMDVFILPAHQGKGHSLQLLQFIMAHPELQGLRRFMLASSNARGLYQRFGFTQLGKPEVMMEINVADIYSR
ncbi:GNAT family N-acetyltransferase [Undibacterium flavidum]|uniref:GNAT family N-acetyltransferase n=1 Tax=Undibacterium flavidum TaxID=2762297 RepID=A0ABR6Y7L8_9BURK|nr:GNAT family N-acetyltransferase [Undibacterium flavidum]MBC3872597.1 GNAT family N-acetyltransferase [Undibacterium flavidum]